MIVLAAIPGAITALALIFARKPTRLAILVGLVVFVLVLVALIVWGSPITYTGTQIDT